MLKLNQLYFRNYFLLFFGTIILLSTIGYFLLEKVEISNHKTMLNNMINQIIVTNKNLKNLNKIIHDINHKTSVRTTIIDKSGKVIYESSRNIEGMENHLHRPEIQQSLKNEFGYSIRHSVSVNANMLYVAKMDNGYFVRMSFPLRDIKSKFIKFWLGAIFLFSLSILISILISVKINRKINADITDIKNSLDNLLNKKYDVEFGQKRCCEELDTISLQISQVSRKLEKREKQKSKFAKNLKALNKKQSDIISAIGHEFKNPIAAVIGYGQSIKDDRDLSITIRDKFLDKVISNAHKISNMINRISMAIKYENDTIEPEFTSFNILCIAQDIKEMLLLKHKDRQIIINMPDMIIQADRVMLENVLTNLIENALKYSENDVVLKIEDGYFEVIDSGIGIEIKDLQNVTKRFYRVESLTWDNSIGVGLYIVEYILKMHKSELKIDSELGVGSKFYFDLKPMVQTELT